MNLKKLLAWTIVLAITASVVASTLYTYGVAQGVLLIVIAIFIVVLFAWALYEIV
jgi:hypothetical protein